MARQRKEPPQPLIRHHYAEPGTGAPTRAEAWCNAMSILLDDYEAQQAMKAELAAQQSASAPDAELAAAA